jgi:hypothetical protein
VQRDPLRMVERSRSGEKGIGWNAIAKHHSSGHSEIWAKDYPKTSSIFFINLLMPIAWNAFSVVMPSRTEFTALDEPAHHALLGRPHLMVVDLFGSRLVRPLGLMNHTKQFFRI